MIKLIGALLTVGATTLIGLKKVDLLKSRVLAIETLLSALEIMRSEVYFKLTPMPEIIVLLAETCETPAKEFFETCLKKLEADDFEFAWKGALSETLGAILVSADMRMLEQLGGIMGRYDLEGQLRCIDNAISRLTKSKQEAELDKANNSKVYAVLGMASGLAAVLIFI